ncbi:MAG: tRNA dihydrouridine(20/20a) synthase DusA [Spirochaetales bacterium]|nr:MAG: tRNA dihydrouridine(20/20a) synthase DusA [Spirochaetales bacterium]
MANIGDLRTIPPSAGARKTVTSDSGTLRTPPISIAPMMEKTDRHYRYFMRQITRHTLLYTEMVTTGAIIHGDRDYLLGFSEAEHPISLQLGGDNPDELYKSIRIASAYDYDEYNLNVGCPSDRVQNGNFGACLMATPTVVRDLVEAMKAATDRPVTVKHRIGIDGRESYEEMKEFVLTVNSVAPARFTVHSRIAILAGLSPKENRTVPPLRYEDVYRLKTEIPTLQVEINGGIKTADEIQHHLERVDGVMIGRAAYDDPWFLSDADQRFFGATAPRPTRRSVIEAMKPYIDQWQAHGWPARNVLRHMLGLFAYQEGTRKFKQRLSGPLPDHLSGSELLDAAVAGVPDRVLDA